MQLNKNKIFQSNVYAEINIINLQAKVAELRGIMFGLVKTKSFYGFIKYKNATLTYLLYSLGSCC